MYKRQAKHGILIQDVQALETAHAISVVAFDKTGTLTEGKPSLSACEPAPGFERRDVLALAARVQSGSEHPLARAVLQAARQEGLAPAGAALDIHALAGRGVRGRVDGQLVWVGSARMLTEIGVDPGAMLARGGALADAGATVSFVACAPADAPEQVRLAGVLAFGDRIKPGAARGLQRLRDLGIRTVMLTGDNPGAAQAVAAQLPLDEVRAQVLPEQKSQAIADLRAGGRQVVAMVGDGVNDAPALAAADVGIAMSTGTDVAMHTAGITLMQGDPGLVADAVSISRRTWSKIRQNLFWAFIYNLVGIPLAAFGQLDPVLAGAAMAFSSVSVVSNALLLRRWRPGA